MDELGRVTLLLVEGEKSLRRVMSASLEQIGVRVLEAPDAERALEILEHESPEMLVVERDFPHDNNGALIEAFRQHGRSHQDAVVVTTTQRLKDNWRRRYRPKVTIYKPFDVRHLCRVITSLAGARDKESAEIATNQRSR